VTAAVAHGTDVLGILRFSLVHAAGNLASCAVATSSGFGYEGTERSALDLGDGVLHDMHRHGRLTTDPPGRAEQSPPGPLDPVELPGDGFLLRVWEAADADAVYRGLSDPESARWNPRLPLRDLDQARRWLQGRTERWRDGRACTWAVVEDGRVVGSVALRDLNAIDHFAVASYWTMPEARGRGVAGQALARASTYAFEGLGMHRVELGHAVANTASCRVAEKAGFAMEGTRREATRLADGFVDEHVHARLATDR
jgi:RimJ/RimL family protein N-acetyltransferase